MPRQAFVSYAREDAAQVPAVVERLEQLGYESWLDRALRGGQSWWEEILDQLRRCDVVVVLVSDAAIRSRACAREREYAAALGKPMIPLRVAPVSVPLPRDLVPVHIVDYTGGGSRPGQDLARALTALPPTTPLPDPLPSPPPAPLSYLVALAEVAGSDQTLGRAEQLGVLNELEPGLRAADAEERRAAFAVLAALEARPDLMADTARRIGHLRAENPAAAASAGREREDVAAGDAATLAVPAAGVAGAEGTAVAGATPGAGELGAGEVAGTDDLAPPEAGPGPREIVATEDLAASGQGPATQEMPPKQEAPAKEGDRESQQEMPAQPSPSPAPDPRPPGGQGKSGKERRRRTVLLVALGVVLLVGLGVGAAIWGSRNGGETPDVVDGTTGPTTTPPTTPPPGRVQLGVDSTQVWTATGMACAPGVVLDITATGTILHNKDDESSRVGPDGTDVEWFRQFNVPGLPDANTASLIGSLDRQDPFFVGSDLTYTCPGTGELFLGVNDFEPGLANNSGSFDVTVVRSEP